MIKVCNEKDCPLHPENEWREEHLIDIKTAIKKMSSIGIDIIVLEDLHRLFSYKLELSVVPANCSTCKYMKPADMKGEALAELAKSKLSI